MTLIRRNPMGINLPEWFEDFFSTEMPDLSSMRRTNSIPAVNIAEQADKYIIQVAAPGYTKDDFSVDVDNNVLSIFSEKKNESNETNGNFTKREFNFSSFRRTFTLPDTANVEGIQAKYENGILVVEISKKEAAIIKPKRSISIE